MTSRALLGLAAGCVVGLVGLVGCAFEGNSGSVTPDAPVDSPIDGVPVVSSCPLTYQLVVGTPPTSRYRKLETAKSADQQAALCQADGAHLVVVDSAAERAAIAEYGRNARGFFWIGLSDRETEGVWKTANGHVAVATDLPWGMKQPEADPAKADVEDCVMQQDSLIYDFNCASAYVAVCECD